MQKHPRNNDARRMTASIAIIGSSPTGIYTLSGFGKSERPLSITVFEIEADAGTYGVKGYEAPRAFLLVPVAEGDDTREVAQRYI